MRLTVLIFGASMLALIGCADSQSHESSSLTGPSGSASARITITPEISHALETAVKGQPVTWTDSENGTQTQLTVVRMYQAEDNTYCREFTETISKGGTTDSAHGTACWQPDGTWRAVAG